MNFRRSLFAVLCFALLVSGLLTNSTAMAQESGSSSTTTATQRDKQDETNLDTQLYLLVGTNQDVEDSKLPAALDSVVRQLRSTLPFKNYRLTATLINRVRNDGRLNLKWIGGPLMTTAAASNMTPSFSEFRVNNVRLTTNAAGQSLVRMDGFGFGARIPIQSGTTVASNAPAAPIIAYEPTGLNTDISMREGEPVIVGTLNLGPSGDAIILVMSAKRTLK